MKYQQTSIKIPERDAQLIKEISECRGESFSDFVRRSLKIELARLNFLDEGSRRALGI